MAKTWKKFPPDVCSGSHFFQHLRNDIRHTKQRKFEETFYLLYPTELPEFHRTGLEPATRRLTFNVVPSGICLSCCRTTEIKQISCRYFPLHQKNLLCAKERHVFLLQTHPEKPPNSCPQAKIRKNLEDLVLHRKIQETFSKYGSFSDFFCFSLFRRPQALEFWIRCEKIF
ncbi:MAG: hypothetical protein J6J31_12005 [Thermoguttaceae bacterium]|nr:hypothetical protein [Thermoguttaceae bacterium]